MAIGCGAKCSKFILIAFNILFWLSGLILIVLSIIFLSAGNFKHLDEISEPSSKAMQRFLYGILIIGFVVFFIGFCGCCGAIKESKLLLGIYIVLVIIIITAEIACGIYAVIKKNKVLDRIQTSLENNINKFYRNGSEFEDFRNAIDYFQKNYQCCGYSNPDNWMKTFWYMNQNVTYNIVPKSCCKNPTMDTLKKCYSLENYYKYGCVNIIKSTVSKNFPILIGILIGVGLFEILVVIFACCLCQNTGYLAHSAI